jgi:putative transposase
VVGIFPNESGVLRLAGSILLEVHDEWQIAERRYLSEASMAKLYENDNDGADTKEVGANTSLGRCQNDHAPDAPSATQW